MYCRGCGVHAPDDANFCVSCGDDLRELHDDEPTLDDLPVGGVERAEPVSRDTAESRSAPTQAVPAVGGGSEQDLRTCPACGSPNSPRRYLCGRCGADLESGEGGSSPVVVPSPSSGAGSRATTSTTTDLGSRTSDRRWRIAAGIVLVGLVVGGGLGAMIVFGWGPFAAEPQSVEGSGPVFDRSSYPEEPTPLTVSAVAASTARTGAQDGFAVDRLLDGDTTTAWNSRGDVNPDGVGEIIEFDFAEPVWLSQIVFANGDQEDDESFVANARAKRIQVELYGGSTFIANLLDEPGEQAIRLPTPRFTITVRFEVLEVYPGDTYDDLALSEVSFRGFVANENDAAVARADEPSGE
ncbi:MAG: zinc ribbon domain-containing protein [Nitriliruptorales bacterium]|nr:zinc ribbon domain-containing protein [Nitriliruptorales bacterium]